MPSQRNVGWAKLKVGIMALVSMTVLGVLIFLITGSTSFWEEKRVLYTFLSDSAALAPGANVRLNGIYIGSIKAVELSGDANPRRVVRVAMEVQDAFLGQIPVDSQAAIAAENVLGSKYINIKRGKSPTAVASGAELPALDTSTFDDVVAQGYSVLASAQEMLKRIDGIVSIVEQGKGSIGKFLNDESVYNNLNKTIEETRKVAETINSGKGTIGKLLNDDQILEDARSTIARVNKLMDGLDQGQGTAGKFLKDEGLYNDFRATTQEIHTLVADLNAGKGSAGKLLKDDALAMQLSAALSKMDLLLSRINSGEGTLGQLAVNPQMYESFSGLGNELREFMKDLRANPKKYLSIKLGLF